MYVCMYVMYKQMSWLFNIMPCILLAMIKVTKYIKVVLFYVQYVCMHAIEDNCLYLGEEFPGSADGSYSSIATLLHAIVQRWGMRLRTATWTPQSKSRSGLLHNYYNYCFYHFYHIAVLFSHCIVAQIYYIMIGYIYNIYTLYI